MWLLGSAIVMASLLGSTHCVGMCGPLALWASGTTEASRSRVALNTSLYHLGRLLAYCVVGCLAGVIGELVDLGGETIGLRMAAARLVGGAMIVLGLSRVISMLWSKPANFKTTKASVIGKLLATMRPYVFRLPLAGRAAATGLLTAFLPCGWLYLFAFVAAGTASPLSGAFVMIAFWIGTLPLLVGFVASATMLKERYRKAVPVVAAALLVVTGYYTATSDAFASTDALSALKTAAENDVANLHDTALPCCCPSAKESELP